MQDIRQPTRALTRPRYYDNDFPSNPADYLAANRDLTQRYLQLIDISWIRAHLPRITREQILPHTDPRRTQHSPPIASIAAPNSSRTPGRRVRRPQRQEDTASGQNATDRPPGAHEIRKSKLANLFKPMLEKDFPVILICWGKEERCQIVPVVITDPTDEVTAWQTISQEYYAHKGSWTKYLPWCCVNKVEIADISIAGKKLAKGTGNEYVGIYHTEDLVAKRKHLEQVIADYKPREWFCPYDISTGTVDCVGECVERCMDNEECSERIKYKAERELSLLSLRPILTQCFFRADIAAHNSLLNSEGLIHGHTDILGKLDAWHCPESGEIRFRGLMIRNYWECNQQHALLIIIVILVLLSIPFAKLIFNDWDVAWNVGCFFVGLLGLQWLNNFFVNRCCRSTC